MSVFEQKTNGFPKPNYEYITDEGTARKALNELMNYPELQMDIEATALDPFEARWTLFQVGTGSKSYVFDVRYDTPHSSIHPEIFKPLLTDNKILKILQNANYDMKVIKRSLDTYITNVFDTMLAEQLLNLGRGFLRVNLQSLVDRYLGLAMEKEAGTTFQSYGQVYQEFQLEYAANDVVPLNVIKDNQWAKIKKEQLENAFRLEAEFLVPLCEMELNGIKIDIDKWNIIMKDVEVERAEVKQVIQNILGETDDQSTLFGVSLINIDSNAQLKSALARFGINLDSTAKDALEKYKGIPIIDAILDYRKASKLISTYADSLLAKISPVTGRLHTDFRQMVSTGRLSSANPNLQNIPGKQRFRSCFIAKEGYSLLTADMSGAELRILGNLSNDPVFIEAYATGQDLHTRTASEMFGVPYEEAKQKKYRGAAKAINFGLCTTANTSVITENGMKSIVDAVVGEQIAHDLGCDTVIDAAYMGEKEVFELTTQYGYSIELTADHLIKVINSNGDYVDKKLSDLDIDKDLICLRKGMNIFSNEDVLFGAFDTDKRTNYKEIILPGKLTYDFAAFLGLFVAEGSVQKVKGRSNYSLVSFGFSNKDKEFIERMDGLCYNLFGDRISRIETDSSVFYNLNSVKFAEWLVSLLNFDELNKTDTIVVPACIKKAKKEIQVEFLKWLFEGDGTIKSNGRGYKISYSSNSKRLLCDVQLMLLNFGILSSITEESRKDYDKIYYVLSIVSAEAHELFKKCIGFVTETKNNKCFSEVAYNTSSYFVGNHGNRMREIMSGSKVSQQLKDRFYKSRLNDSVGNIYLKELADLDSFFGLIYENGIVPLHVKDIRFVGTRKVYDLSVENHQYFLANGFIVHNCYGMSAVGLSKRLTITEMEAKQLIAAYFKKYKGVKRYLDNAGKDAVRNRYSVTVSGRRRYYNMPEFDHPDRKKIQGSVERKGKNAGIQGANADTIKEAMILLVERLKPYDAKLILTVHDEVVVEARNDQREEVAEVVANSLIDGFGRYFSTIPMKTDTLVGPCWLKGECEKTPGCGSTHMKFVPSEKYGTKLVCSNCGKEQE